MLTWCLFWNVCIEFEVIMFSYLSHKHQQIKNVKTQFSRLRLKPVDQVIPICDLSPNQSKKPISDLTSSRVPLQKIDVSDVSETNSLLLLSPF